jgi:hypothetical protein
MAKFELVATKENGQVCFETRNDGFNALELVGILESKKIDILNQVNNFEKFKRTLIEDGTKTDISDKE